MTNTFHKQTVSSFAAAWRGDDGAVRATVPDATMCREPRHTRDLATWTEDGGFGTVMRCRNCEGCRNYDRLILRRRLAAHFENWEGNLWLVEARIRTPGRGARSGLSSLIRRLRGYMGFIRQGLAGYALIVASHKRPRCASSSAARWSLRVTRISAARRVAAWRKSTRGMRIERSEYGEWTNRFYIRGLKKLSSQNFVNSTRGGLRKSRAGLPGSVRAVREDSYLVPSKRVHFLEFMAAQKTRRSEAVRRYPVRSPAPRGAVSGVLPRVAHTPAPNGAKGEPSTCGAERILKQSAGVRTALKDTPDLSQGGRDAGSRLKGAEFAAKWLERMLAKHRREGP